MMTFPGIELDNSAQLLPVQGQNLRGPRLGDQFHKEGSLLVFLRHFGCTFCRAAVTELEKARQQNPHYPDVLYIHQGSLSEGAAFFARYAPQAIAISDPQRKIYAAFKVTRGSLQKLVGPQALLSGLKGLGKGYGIGLPTAGDPLVMPGLFFIKNNRIVWKHEYRHAGDHPHFADLPQLLQTSPNLSL